MKNSEFKPIIINDIDWKKIKEMSKDKLIVLDDYRSFLDPKVKINKKTLQLLKEAKSFCREWKIKIKWAKHNDE